MTGDPTGGTTWGFGRSRPGHAADVRRHALLVTALAVALAGCSGDEREAEPVVETELVTVTEPSATTRELDPAGEAESAGDVFGRIPELVREIEPSVVAIAVRGSQGSGEGSGVIWDDEGLIVTNNHVVAGAEDVTVVLQSGARLDAELVASTELFDLALIRVERDGLPAAEFAEELPEVGELALALGNPLGFEQSVTAGIISGLHRSIPSGGRTPALVDLIQTDAPISPGNSGGALVDADGRVIGINVAYIPPEARAVSIGFAIPAPTAADVVRQLRATGRVRRAFLGVTPRQVTPELAEQLGLEVDEGVAVEDVASGTGAARAGIRGGDVIVGIDGKSIATVEDLFAILRQRQPGDRVSVALVRDGDRRQLDVTLGEGPAESE